MHYYKRNIGDYHKKAGRLSILQHGIYTLLMDAIYDREEFPTKQNAIDWTWASSQEEVEAVEFVLKKFFTNGNGVYHQKRIEEELNAFRNRSEINTRIAIERETKRAKQSTKRARSDHESPPNHKPLTTNHKDITPTAYVDADASTCPYVKIVDLYHKNLPMCPKVAKISATRKSHMRARWKDDADNLQYWDDYFQYAAKSKFLTGRTMPSNGRTQPFVADIDFLIREANMIKIREGKYNG